MNVHQLRCAVAVARLGSQTRAAEALYMSQPNLSKAIKELEQTCGFRIFERRGQGMAPTPRGEALLARAQAVLEQVDAFDAAYQSRGRANAYLSVAVPKADYIASALTGFARSMGVGDAMEINAREVPGPEAARLVLSREADIGVVRYQTARQNKVLEELSQQGLHYVLYWSFRPLALMSRRHPLAAEERVSAQSLAPYAQVLFAGMTPYGAQEDRAQEVRRAIRVNDRAARLETLAALEDAYAYSSPAPPETLARYGLVQRPFSDACETWQDALIYLKGYTMNRWEQAFYDQLRQQVDRLSR